MRGYVMRSVFYIASIIAISFVSACSSVRDQYEVTQVDTLAIIKRVRCETAEAVLQYEKSHWINRIAIGYGFDFQSIENNAASMGLARLTPIHGGTLLFPITA